MSLRCHDRPVAQSAGCTAARRATTTTAATAMLALSCLLALAGGIAARPAPAADARWDARLARLDPVRPMDYLELGEEVADQAVSDAERRLARELFGYAGALDPTRLGRSAMLALASIAESDAERARALAAAELVGGRGASRAGLVAEPAQVEALARAISYHRRGEGRKALAALKQGDGDGLLDEVGVALSGGAEVFREECKAARAGASPVSDEDVIARGLLIEHALRTGDLRTPGLDMALFGDAPLVEIDLTDPESTWRVDPSRPWWRDGKWSGNG